MFAESENRKWTLRALLQSTIIRPFTMITVEPILLLVTIYISVVYGIVYGRKSHESVVEERNYSHMAQCLRRIRLSSLISVASRFPRLALCLSGTESALCLHSSLIGISCGRIHSCSRSGEVSRRQRNACRLQWWQGQCSS